ncbi:hypothetical protein CBR_g3079 [Chara braunii]|uniref:Uncharacterized protein n=1 Tax=Chara braunii TaxID=69332 RepID=A0A388KEP5_CHABU|nr:hypothetical protein CBR_g3079 [Chara braunii]|eukprot:GBG68535.1 hypothetical protein CBR_g3079 [Chara braunii]
MAGPSGPTLRKGGQRRDQKISRSMEVLPVYGAGDNLRVFLRDFEEYGFRREWGDKEKLANVTGTGVYKRKIEGAAAGCARWRACKVRLWKEMGTYPRDDVEDDLKFDGTNLEDFIDSLQLAAEKGEWSEEEKKKQEVKEGEKGEKEGKLRRVKEVEVEVGKKMVEYGESSQLREEVEEGQVSKEEKAQKCRKRKGWRDYVIRMLQYDDLPVNSAWDVRFERMLLSELVVSSSHSDNLQKMMDLHKLLDEKCTRLFEDYAEIARKMGKMEGEGGAKEVGEDLDTVGKGLQAKLKGSNELFTQGFLDYIPGLLKEMSRLRKKEEERDAQVTQLVGEVEGMKKEVEELKKGREELEKQVSTLKASLTMKGKELENEIAERGRVEKKVEGICSEVSMQGQDLDNEISEREKLGQDWEKRWVKY